MKDIIVGAIDNYTWDQVRPWISSIQRSGFTGDIWLITYRIDRAVIEQIEKTGVQVYEVGHTPFLQPIQHNQFGPTQAHNLRFFHIWELLTRLDMSQYRFAITTDVRDVIFQSNPSIWLDNNLRVTDHFIAPSEGIIYEKEEWNAQNMKDGYGPVVWDLWMKDKVACNVGTIGARASFLPSLALTIYSMTTGRHYPSDQSSFNVLAHHVFRDRCYVAPMMSGWAAQIGTALDPTKSWLHDRLIEPAPIIDSDGTVRTSSQKFVIVHQWDRHPQLKAHVLATY